MGEERSLIPESVRMMALTATATVHTRKSVCKTLGMVKSAVIADSPNKVNIKYIVHHNPGTLEELLHPLWKKYEGVDKPLTVQLCSVARTIPVLTSICTCKIA